MNPQDPGQQPSTDRPVGGGQPASPQTPNQPQVPPQKAPSEPEVPANGGDAGEQGGSQLPQPGVGQVPGGQQ